MFVTGKGLIGAKVCFFGGSHYKRMEMKVGLFTTGISRHVKTTFCLLERYTSSQKSKTCRKKRSCESKFKTSAERKGNRKGEKKKYNCVFVFSK